MAGLPWETLDETVAYSCDGFDIVNETVRLPDGEETEFDYLSESESVVILPFTPYGKVVVIDEWRQAVGRTNRGIPAGTVEPEDRDDLERAAARELAEETGHEAADFERLTTVEPANGVTNAVHHHFLATGCEPTADRDLDRDESIAVETVPYDDLLASVVDDGLRDGRAVTAVTWYELLYR